MHNDYLLASPTLKKEYSPCIKEWVKGWHVCVAADGSYLENKINLPESQLNFVSFENSG